MLAGVRSTTAKSYSSSQRGYIKFCRSLNLIPVPAEAETVLLYVTHLHNQSTSHGSIKVHLAAIRNLHIINGYAPPDNSHPPLKMAIKAIQDSTPAPSQKLPLTFEKIKLLWPLVKKDKNSKLWQAVLSLAFFAGLRCNEYAVSSTSSTQYAPRVNSVSFLPNGVMKFKVVRSKTRIHGMTVTLGCSQVEICAPCKMVNYLKSHEESHVKADSFLFQLQGSPLTSSMVNCFIASLVQAAGWDSSLYSAHSLRAGAASSAAQAGFQEWEFKKLGGWESKAYQSYIREQDQAVAGFAKRLAVV